MSNAPLGRQNGHRRRRPSGSKRRGCVIVLLVGASGALGAIIEAARALA